jgi:hypothetical protein
MIYSCFVLYKIIFVEIPLYGAVQQSAANFILFQQFIDDNQPHKNHPWHYNHLIIKNQTSYTVQHKSTRYFSISILLDIYRTLTARLDVGCSGAFVSPPQHMKTEHYTVTINIFRLFTYSKRISTYLLTTFTIFPSMQGFTVYSLIQLDSLHVEKEQFLPFLE